MKPKANSAPTSLKSVRILAATAICLGIPLMLLAASGPTWWYNSSFTTSGTAPLVSGTANDYAAANQGQMKNMAVTAVNELTSALPGGAGSTLNSLALSLTATSGSTSDYATVNLGQLKTLAKPFYDRLFSIDYDGPPIYSSTNYPWVGGTAADYAAANIGQVKNLFSFDLTYSSDGNPLPDWWRKYYFGTLSVSATSTFPIDGGGVTYLEAYQQQLSPLPAPVFSPPGELLRSATEVAISATGATAIYYTTNGADPATSGSLYSTPIPISGATTLRAIAYSGSAASEEGAAAYWVLGGSNPNPIAAGQYHSLAIRSDGSLWACGANTQYTTGTIGQLGIGSYVDQWYPTQVTLPSSVISVAAGSYHTLAVTSDGKVWAWGLNDDNQLGVSSTTYYTINTPTLVMGGTNAVAVAAGPHHSMALTSGSAVLTWGDNTYGELGYAGSSGTTPEPVSIGGSAKPIAIAAGGSFISAGYFSLALTSDGSVWAWGDDTYGQCGQGVVEDGTYDVATKVIDLTDITAIAAGDQHALALESNGTVWAWGRNNNGQLGCGSGITESGTPVEIMTSATSALSDVASIAAGTQYSIAVKGDGTVWQWGNLGNGLTGAIFYATQVNGISGAVGAAAGLHALIAGSNGTVTAMGEDTNGEFGAGFAAGAATSSTTPVLSMAFLLLEPTAPTFTPDGGIYSSAQQVVVSCTDSEALIYYTTDGSVPGPENGSIIQSGKSLSVGSATMLRACAVAGGVSSPIKSAAYHMGYQTAAAGWHSVLLDTNGSVYTWGSNLNGELGLNWNSGDQVIPQLVTGLSGSARAISAGESNSAAIVNSGTNIGTVWVWGSDADAQCGIVSSTNYFNAPFQVQGISGATGISCGWFHVAAVTGSGTVSCWGANGYGQLGNGTTTFEPSPVSVVGLSGVTIKAVAAGEEHTLALSTSGTVYAWGNNQSGQLGYSTIGTGTDVAFPVPGLNHIIAIAAGEFSSYALRNDGTVWGWGVDGYGVDLLADDLGNYETGPVLIGTVRDVVAIAAGENHCVALRGDGSYLAWGRNNNDDITSSASDPSLPAVVPGVSLTAGTTSLPSISTMVSAGDDHSLIVANTSGVQTLWAWGYNASGQLGNGTVNSQYPPPSMVDFTGYAFSSYDGMPDWLALEMGLDPFTPYSNSYGIPETILYADGLGINPALPYTPYQLPTGTGGGTAPTIYITVPAGASLH